jgi:hypothetical protein
MLDVGGTNIIEHQIENLMLAGIPSRRPELQRGDDDARRPRHCAGEPRLQRRHQLRLGVSQMNRKNFLSGILAAGCFIATCTVMPSIVRAQADPRITKSMESLKAMTAKLGAPKLEGKETVGGKEAPALYFGATKINNNFDIVDAVGKEDGKGMTATLFAKDGDEYIRVSTSVPKPDGSGRAVGTVLAGLALESIKAGNAYYGQVAILGTPYITGYEPIRDSSGAQIGVYYVGYWFCWFCRYRSN